MVKLLNLAVCVSGVSNAMQNIVFFCCCFLHCVYHDYKVGLQWESRIRLILQFAILATDQRQINTAQEVYGKGICCKRLISWIFLSM